MKEVAMPAKGSQKESNGFALYDAKIRLSGSMLNEVRKCGITAPEAMIYQSIHGPDSLAEIKAAKGEVTHRESSDRIERERLARMFEISSEKRGFIAKVFGPPTMALPRTMPEDFEVDQAIPMGNAPDDAASAVLAS